MRVLWTCAASKQPAVRNSCAGTSTAETAHVVQVSARRAIFDEAPSPRRRWSDDRFTVRSLRAANDAAVMLEIDERIFDEET